MKNESCWYCKLVKVGEICPRCEKAKSNDLELHNGFTVDQWQKIAKLPVPIICEFWSGKGDHILVSLIQEILPQKATWFKPVSSVTLFDNCRVVSAPNHWQPWFGGECPVGAEKSVFCLLRDGGYVHKKAGSSMDWSSPDSLPSSSIIAYMVLSHGGIS